MKCRACGHEETTGEEFLQIQVLGATQMAGILESLAIVVEKGARQHVDLYACPRCGTVRLEKSLERSGY